MCNIVEVIHIHQCPFPQTSFSSCSTGVTLKYRFLVVSDANEGPSDDQEESVEEVRDEIDGINQEENDEEVDIDKDGEIDIGEDEIDGIFPEAITGSNNIENDSQKEAVQIETTNPDIFNSIISNGIIRQLQRFGCFGEL